MPSYWVTEEALLNFPSTIRGLLLFILLVFDSGFLLLTLNLRVDGVDAVGAGGLGTNL